jgi:hypothetical protein
MNTWLSLIPEFLRSPETLWDEIRRGKQLSRTVFRMGVLTAVYLAVYGFALGLSHSWLQALSSAVKMPLLILATIFFCLPALHFFSLAVMGTPRNILSTAAVVLAGVGVMAFLLLGLAPVTLFFVLTSKDYPFFQLLAVSFVAICGMIGLDLLRRGMTALQSEAGENRLRTGRGLLAAWIGLFAFVASQMTWRLSPLVGDPSKSFVILQPSRDNFYVDVLRAVQRAFGFTATSRAAGSETFFFCGTYVFLFALAVWMVGRGMKKRKARFAAGAPIQPGTDHQQAGGKAGRRKARRSPSAS